MSTQRTPLADKPGAFKEFANAGLLEFPTDEYGVTSRLRREMISVASRVGSDPDKLLLVVSTLDILQKHMQGRFDEAVELADAEFAAAEAEVKAADAAAKKAAKETKAE